MKAVSPLQLRTTPSTVANGNSDNRKLSIALSLNIAKTDSPLQKTNLLANSLICKLKQPLYAIALDKENISSSKTPFSKQSKRSRPQCSDQVSALSQGRNRPTTATKKPQQDDFRSRGKNVTTSNSTIKAQAQRGGSAASSSSKSNTYGEKKNLREIKNGNVKDEDAGGITDKSKRRIDRASSSASSDHGRDRDSPFKLSRRKSSTFNILDASQRSNSAGTSLDRGILRSGTTRLTSASSFFHSSDSTGLALESRGADYTIKVMKKDGVFQPIDKYASCRYLPRDAGREERAVACEYELFTLTSGQPEEIMMNHPAKTGTGINLLDGEGVGNKRAMKVSWSKTMDDGECYALESRMDSIPPSSMTPNNASRILSSSSSYKRPIYSSGQSQVQSIGLRWRVPTAPPDDEKVHQNVVAQAPKKPIWSWLLNPQIKQKGGGGGGGGGRMQKAGGLLNVESTKKLNQPNQHANTTIGATTLNRTSSNIDVRTQHSRDLHPVSTAMAREGTSVSKTKWFVPSSTTSTLEAERIAMDRLEFVKREGSKIRPDQYTYTYNNTTFNDLDDTFKNAGPDHVYANINDNDESEDENNEYDDVRIRRRLMDDTTSYGTKSNADTVTSPSKSRSSFYYNYMHLS